MNKNPPSIGRIAAMVGFTLSVAALLMFLWTAFGGTLPLRPEGYRFKADFPEASLLVKEADVRMAGVNIGKVKTKELGQGGRTTVVEMEIDNRFAPIGRDARAILRQKSLLGETYVELTPGSPGGQALDDGGTLAQANVEDTVELDEVFRVFDPKTRDAFQQWLHEAGIVTSGRFARDFNDSLGNAAPFFTDGASLLRPLAEQEVALRRVFRDTGRVFNAVSREDGQLRGLITKATRPSARSPRGTTRSPRRSRCSRPSCARRARRYAAWRRSPTTPTRWCATCASRRRTWRRRCATSATCRPTSRSSSTTSTRSCARPRPACRPRSAS